MPLCAALGFADPFKRSGSVVVVVIVVVVVAVVADAVAVDAVGIPSCEEYPPTPL